MLMLLHEPDALMLCRCTFGAIRAAMRMKNGMRHQARYRWIRTMVAWPRTGRKDWTTAAARITTTLIGVDPPTPALRSISSTARTMSASPEASKPTQVSQLNTDSPLPPRGPYAARDTAKVEVPVFGPCRLARPTSRNARLARTMAKTAWAKDSPMEITTAPLTT